MISGATVAVGAATTAAPSNQWTTKLHQCDQVPPPHWLLAIFCLPCAAAKAKSKVDQSNPFFNFMCWTPVGTYSFVRASYNIVGDGGEDCCNGGICMPCGTRQVFTEASQLGPLAGGSYGQTTNAWTAPLFECQGSECAMATFCPCMVSSAIRVLMQPSTSGDKWFNLLCVVPTGWYGQVRHTAGIGSEWPHPVMEDLIVGSFCYPCALNRAQKEATAYRAKQAASSAVSKGVSAVSNMIGGFKARIPGMK